MAWEWITTDMVPLTRELAEKIAGLPHFEGDRPWDSNEGKNRMQWLSSLVDQGKFYPPRWATAAFEGGIYRVNGGTSSHMLAARDVFPENLYVMIDRFTCQTIEDVADLFSQFDHRKSIRTLVQKVRAHKAAEQLLSSISPTDVNACITGIAAAEHGFERVEEEDRVRMMHIHAPFIVFASPFSRRRHTRQKGPMAAMFYTWRKDPIYAIGFWQEVADGSNPDHQHPTRVLCDFLKGQVGIGEKKFTSKATCIKCIHAWNAARTNTRTALKVYNANDLPPIR